MPDHVLTCSCNNMEWRIAGDAAGTHLCCYCADCQTAARHLGHAELLNDHQGVHIFQTLPSNVAISKGAEHLGLLRLSPNGLFRWHAGCCGTPITTTLPKPSLPFAGMVLPDGGKGFGPVRAHVNTSAARPPRAAKGTFGAVWSMLLRGGFARLRGDRTTPFFDADGAPVVAPHVISLEERDAARPV